MCSFIIPWKIFQPNSLLLQTLAQAGYCHSLSSWSVDTLVLHNITALHLSFDSHQCGYRAKWSTGDAITIATHSALSHLDHHRNHVLFAGFSSDFNTIILDLFAQQTSTLGFFPTICAWIKDSENPTHLHPWHWTLSRPDFVCWHPSLRTPLYSAYRNEIQQWSSVNNTALNTTKIKELTLAAGKSMTQTQPYSVLMESV